MFFITKKLKYYNLIQQRVLHDRLAYIGSQCIVDVLKKYDFFEAVPQSNTGIIYASKIDKNESKIDWNKSAIEIDRQIRGLSPFPGAWFDDGEQRIKVLMSEVVEGSWLSRRNNRSCYQCSLSKWRL